MCHFAFFPTCYKYFLCFDCRPIEGGKTNNVAMKNEINKLVVRIIVSCLTQHGHWILSRTFQFSWMYSLFDHFSFKWRKAANDYDEIKKGKHELCVWLHKAKKKINEWIEFHYSSHAQHDFVKSDVYFLFAFALHLLIFRLLAMSLFFFNISAMVTEEKNDPVTYMECNGHLDKGTCGEISRWHIKKERNMRWRNFTSTHCACKINPLSSWFSSIFFYFHFRNESLFHESIQNWFLSVGSSQKKIKGVLLC